MAKRGRPKKSPQARNLPGMGDRAIKALEDIAHEYADVRDQRMELTKSEVNLKQRAMSELKRLGKTAYKRNGIEIAIVPGDETIRVRVAKPDEAADADDAAEEGAPA